MNTDVGMGIRSKRLHYKDGSYYCITSLCIDCAKNSEKVVEVCGDCGPSWHTRKGDLTECRRLRIECYNNGIHCNFRRDCVENTPFNFLCIPCIEKYFAHIHVLI
jgi:hypothetical protein